MAHAEKQASILEGLAQKFAVRWLLALKANGIAPIWEHQFSFKPNEVLKDAEGHESSVGDADDKGFDSLLEDKAEQDGDSDSSGDVFDNDLVM